LVQLRIAVCGCNQVVTWFRYLDGWGGGTRAPEVAHVLRLLHCSERCGFSDTKGGIDDSGIRVSDKSAALNVSLKLQTVSCRLIK